MNAQYRSRPYVAALATWLATAMVMPHVMLAQTAGTIPATPSSEHVVLVITDGLRWQEVFRGAEQALMGKPGKVRDSTSLHRDFWRETPEARRATLLPFLWGTVARDGQLFGDSASGSVARITNRYKFSYPGYSETFTGFFDPRIDSNNFPPNPNTTVFEWLHRDAAFTGQVEAYATWAAFRRIINTERSGVPVRDGWDRGAPDGTSPEAMQLRTLYQTTTRLWGDNAMDGLMHEAMRIGTTGRLPKVLFIGYGETDEWAHEGRYDLYLRAAQQVDRFLESLWTAWQANPATRNKVTLLISTDHGRGWGREWTDHGEDVHGAEFIWSAAIGPDVAPLGVRRNTPTTQAQMASTIAAALGRKWQGAEPRAAPPLPIFR